MARKPTKGSKSTIRQFRSDLAKLKKAGLTKVDVRSQKPTKHFRKVIRENRDVIKGSATAVKIKGGRTVIASDLQTRKRLTRSRVLAREFGGRTKQGRVIVHASKGSNPRYDAGTGRFTVTVTKNGKRQRASLIPSKQDFHQLEQQGFQFAVPFSRGKGKVDWRTYTSADELLTDMKSYEAGPRKYLNWQDHTVIVRRGAELDDEEGEQ